MNRARSRTSLYAVAFALTLGCSSAPSATPGASAQPTASATPAAPAPAPITCDTVSERVGGAPGAHEHVALEGSSPAIASYRGSHAMTVASVVTKTTFEVVEPLGTDTTRGARLPYMGRGPGPIRHPNAPRSGEGLVARHLAHDELVDQLFVVLVDANGDVARYIPALDEREARAMGALLAKDSCAP